MSQNESVFESSAKMGTLLGVCTIILGMVALFMPFVSGLAISSLVAILLVAAGVVRFVYAFRATSFASGLWGVIVGVVSIAGGVAMLNYPMLGLESMTLVLVMYLIAEGILESVIALRGRPAKGWGWMLVSGIVSIGLGAYIYSTLPASGLFSIGVLVGVDLIFSGWAMIAIASSARALAANVSGAAQV
ncbi:MAG: HdeD family acid-resistance protein [Polyangiales bacterium]